MIRRVNPTEHQIQAAIVEWANNIRYGGAFGQYLGNFLIAIPNGGKRNISEAVRLKKEGVKKGVSDLFLAIPLFVMDESSVFGGHTVSGLWLEIKTDKGRVSKEQILWGDNMCLIGYRFSVARSVDEGINAIKDYLGIK